MNQRCANQRAVTRIKRTNRFRMLEEKERMMSTLAARPSIRLAALALVIAGCGSASAPSAVPATEPPASGSVATPASASPTASVALEPSPIDPGTVEPEPALERLWSAKVPAGADAFAHPVIDASGRIWVGAFQRNEFWAFDREGKHLETWDAGSETASSGHFGGMAFGPDDRIYVADSAGRRVLVFDKDRRPLKEFGGFRHRTRPVRNPQRDRHRRRRQRLCP